MVLSHGFRGNWGNQSWLASPLAHQWLHRGGSQPPRTTTHDRRTEAAAQLWQRPIDLQRAIDAVMAQPDQFGRVAKRQIAVAGHSLGGWTALEIAGARFDPKRFVQTASPIPSYPVAAFTSRSIPIAHRLRKLDWAAICATNVSLPLLPRIWAFHAA